MLGLDDALFFFVLHLGRRVASMVVGGMVRRGAESSDEAAPRVHPNLLAERRYGYRRWAEKRGLERDPRWSDGFRGERDGRPIRLRTGVPDDARAPRPLSIEIRHTLEPIGAVVVLTRETPSLTPVGRALHGVVEHEGVDRVEITTTLVRIVFDPMVTTPLLDPACDELSRALSQLGASAGAMVYR
ncbi:MAG: hypothetical protein JST00_06340 [Deltaproteobacteria bacterium]|nr:hypothetical protein [Deltaproteobacteria bacterium]